MHISTEDLKSCKLCGFQVNDDCVHDYEEQILTDNCESGGIIVECCTKCHVYGDLYKEFDYIEHIPVHDASQSYSPDCSNYGLEVYICKICDKQVYRVTTAPTGHEYDENNCCTKCHKEFPKN